MLKMCFGLPVNYPLFLQDVNKPRGFSTDFPDMIECQMSNVKFHDNPSSCSRVIPSGQKDRQTTQLTVAVPNFMNAPKYEIVIISHTMLQVEASTINSVRVTRFAGISHFEIRKCIYGFRGLGTSCVMSNAKAIYHSVLFTFKTARYYLHRK